MTRLSPVRDGLDSSRPWSSFSNRLMRNDPLEHPALCLAGVGCGVATAGERQE